MFSKPGNGYADFHCCYYVCLFPSNPSSMKHVILMLTIAMLPGFSIAQKKHTYAHVNTAEILPHMTETKEGQLALQKLTVDYQKNLAEIEGRLQSLAKIVQNPAATEEEQAKNQAHYQKVAQEYEEFAYRAEQDLSQKELLLKEDVLSIIYKAVDEVAKAQGIHYVFDTNMTRIWYYEKANDITASVQKILGIEAPAPTGGGQ